MSRIKPLTKAQRLAVDTEQYYLCESVADIAYQAGVARHYSGDSRADIGLYVDWAHEFERGRVHDADGNVLYRMPDGTLSDYMDAVEAFAQEKLAQVGHCGALPAAVRAKA